MPFADAVDTDATAVQAAVAVPRYFAAYEKAFELPVYRPVSVTVVCTRDDRLVVESDRLDVSARGIINATGTWEAPYIPEYPCADRFRGRQLHTREYRTAEEFVGQHVVIVGGGISAIQLLDEILRVTSTTWVTRRPPQFREGPFDEEAGRADVILWCTGFRSALDHPAPLQLREPDGGIIMTGRLATQVAKDPRVHLVGYGPSAFTIGANQAGSAAATELTAFLKLR